MLPEHSKYLQGNTVINVNKHFGLLNQNTNTTKFASYSTNPVIKTSNQQNQQNKKLSNQELKSSFKQSNGVLK